MRNLNKEDLYNPSGRKVLALGATALALAIGGEAAGIFEFNLPDWSQPTVQQVHNTQNPEASNPQP